MYPRNVFPRSWTRLGVVAAAATTALLIAAPSAQAVNPGLTKVVSDPFTNPDSQHATSVEPDTFAFGSTIVTAAQVGRYFDGGASDIGFGTSTDGGLTWTSGVLPGITNKAGGSFDRTTDPSVAFDARHGVWLISSLPLLNTASGPLGAAVVVNRSTDGITWSGPVNVAVVGAGQDFDKNWTACDNHPASPFYGNCYTEFDDFGAGDLILMSTSHDGGLTWSAPVATANRATGLGGQPVVQPNGTVIVPAASAFENAIISFRSTDGGASWSRTVTVSRVRDHTEAGNLRSGPLPSAEIDAAGKVYVVWQDCRFRKRCASNDIVLSTSTDGVAWSAVTRVPIDPTTSTVDHFIPGIAVDSGSTTRLGLTYYFYDNSACGSSCQLRVGFVQSADAGATWTAPLFLAGPFPVTWTANTSQGRMVGDYISTSWIGGRAFGAFAVADPPTGSVFDEATYVPTGGVAASAGARTGAGDQAVATGSDHPDRRAPVRTR
jgi:hypothetical protein